MHIKLTPANVFFFSKITKNGDGETYAASQHSEKNDNRKGDY